MQPKVSGWEITVGNWHYVNGSRLLTKSTALKDNDWVFNSSASPENSKPEYSLNGTFCQPFKGFQLINKL